MVAGLRGLAELLQMVALSALGTNATDRLLQLRVPLQEEREVRSGHLGVECGTRVTVSMRRF